MRAEKCFKYFAIILAFLVINVSSQVHANEEALGRKAEQAGKFRQALTHYVSALQSASEGSSTERRLREKIIRLAPKIQPPPAVSEQAERHMLRGEAAIEMARDNTGFEKAAKEFKAALRVAPWLADGYFNLFVAQEKAGDYADSIRNARLYLLAAPGAPDADVVRKNIIKLEYKLEASKQEQKEKEKKGVESLAGIWRKKNVSLLDRDRNHFRIEVKGEDLLVYLIWDHPIPGSGKIPGKEYPYYELQWDGEKLIGRVISYKHKVPVKGIVSTDYDEIKFTEWWSFAEPPESTSIYGKVEE